MHIQVLLSLNIFALPAMHSGKMLTEFKLHWLMSRKVTIISLSQSGFLSQSTINEACCLTGCNVFHATALFVCFFELSHSFAAFFIQITSSQEVSSSSLAGQIHSLVFFGDEIAKTTIHWRETVVRHSSGGSVSSETLVLIGDNTAVFLTRSLNPIKSLLTQIPWRPLCHF